MAATHELWVVQRQDNAVGIQEFGVEYHLHTVVAPVEQLNPPQVVEYLVAAVVKHVVCDDGGQRRPRADQVEPPLQRLVMTTHTYAHTQIHHPQRHSHTRRGK